jgi:hypothetical protein
VDPEIPAPTTKQSTSVLGDMRRDVRRKTAGWGEKAAAVMRYIAVTAAKTIVLLQLVLREEAGMDMDMELYRNYSNVPE